jgi:hypothetical protein
MNENVFYERCSKIVSSNQFVLVWPLLKLHLHERCAGTKTHSMEQYICH